MIKLVASDGIHISRRGLRQGENDVIPPALELLGPAEPVGRVGKTVILPADERVPI